MVFLDLFRWAINTCNSPGKSALGVRTLQLIGLETTLLAPETSLHDILCIMHLRMLGGSGQVNSERERERRR